MSQSKLGSFVETITNVVIGYVIAIAAQLYIFPRYGIIISLYDNLEMGVFFTVVSIIRTYCLRRWFNARLHAFTEKL